LTWGVDSSSVVPLLLGFEFFLDFMGNGASDLWRIR